VTAGARRDGAGRPPAVPILRRALDSAAFRSGPVARAIVRALPAAPRRRGLPPAPFRLLCLCGRQHLPLLRESLRTLLSTWAALPELLVVSDGSMAPDDLSRALSFWPVPVATRSRDDVAARARALGVPLVDAFASISGFGAKFAAIVTSALERPTLFVDADVLWYRDFSAEVAALAADRREVVLRVSEDYQRAYDEEVLAAAGETLSEQPFVNSGIVFLRGDLLREVDLSAALGPASRRPHQFAEQTLLALAAKRLGVPLFDRDRIACFASDNQTLGPSYRGRGWCARHYVGPVRHIFWRDALALRLGVSA
jgi:hypothetical protein